MYAFWTVGRVSPLHCTSFSCGTWLYICSNWGVSWYGGRRTSCIWRQLVLGLLLPHQARRLLLSYLWVHNGKTKSVVRYIGSFHVFFNVGLNGHTIIKVYDATESFNHGVVYDLIFWAKFDLFLLSYWTNNGSFPRSPTFQVFYFFFNCLTCYYVWMLDFTR